MTESAPSTAQHEGAAARIQLPASQGFFPPPKGDVGRDRNELLLNGAPIKAGGGYIEHCDVEEEFPFARKKIISISTNERRNEEEFELLEIDEEMTRKDLRVNERIHIVKPQLSTAFDGGGSMEETEQRPKREASIRVVNHYSKNLMGKPAAKGLLLSQPTGRWLEEAKRLSATP